MSFVDKAVEVGGWIIAASLMVLVVTHASQVATLISSGSNAVQGESRLLATAK